MSPEVQDAWRAAAASSVSLEQLQAAASKRIAAATQTEAGLVTSGAFAGLTLGTAAILCGHDVGRMEQLPRTADFPQEFIVAREQRSGYDHAVRAAGATLVEVGFNELAGGTGVRRTEAWEFEAAIGPQTAGILYVQNADARPALEDVVEVARRHRIPVLVDAAAELPPRTNLHAIPGSGADLVVFSGGKALGGPQSTGILCGRRDLVMSAALQMLDMDDHPELWDPPADWIDRSRLVGIPRHGIGRGFKVAREEIAALLTALQRFTDGPYERRQIQEKTWLDQIAADLVAADVAVQWTEPATAEHSPTLEIAVNDLSSGQTAMQLCRALRDGSPPVYVGHSKLPQGILIINPVCLQADSISDLTRCLVDALAPTQ